MPATCDEYNELNRVGTSLWSHDSDERHTVTSHPVALSRWAAGSSGPAAASLCAPLEPGH